MLELTGWKCGEGVCVGGSRLTKVTDRTDGGDRGDGSIDGDDDGDTLATADAIVCVGGSRH